MKSFLLLSLALLGGCGTGIKTPERNTSNQIATTVTAVREDVADRAAGNNSAIDFTANRLPESREKEVIKIFVDDQFRLLGQPRAKTQSDFEAAASALLSANAAERAKGETLRLKLAGENEELKAKLKKAEADFTAARLREEEEHRAQLAQARLEGEEKNNRLISYIFFGGGALLVAIGVVILVTAAHNPLFGPRVGFGVIGAGGASVFTGILVTQLMKQLAEHGWILWTGFGTILLLLTGAAAIAWSNHIHHTDVTK